MRKVTGFIVLIATWVLLFYTLTFLTTLILAPWDTALVRPDLGTWQRSANDFFESAPGQYVVALGLIVLSVRLGWAGLRCDHDLRWRFAVINGLCFCAMLVVFMAAALLNNAVFPYPPVSYDPTYEGYHRAVIPGLALLAVCAVWLMSQRRIVNHWLGRQGFQTGYTVRISRS
ncbi:MAG: hypothetical protein K8J31_13395 [Anaerolineae bacterium]|nr:hypothetical protein [Anaerolineae bacterium]